MRSFRTAALLALPLAMASMLAAPAHADVKDGVDAWQAGNYQAAVAEWRPLALAGDADAQFNLGQAYKLGRGVPADLVQAEAWYRRAAKQGHLQAEDNLGLVLFTANRRQEAMPFIINSAARGEPRAQYVLGTAHFNGDLAAEDWPRAYALTKRASDAGLDIASARLAQLDSLIPLDQRRRGLAMIPEIEHSEQQARLAAVNAAAPPAPKPAPASPVKVASVPASTPGTRYTPPPVIETPRPPRDPMHPLPPSPPPPPMTAPEPLRSVALPPAGQAAADAAAEAAAAARSATAAAAPSGPGTTYAAPPESGKLPPKPAEPKPVPVKAVPVKAAPVATAAATPAPVRVHNGTASPWRAQLGAFGVEANARNLWASLEKKNSAFAGRTPYLVKSGKLTRLQAGGFANKGEAESFCAAASKSGQACMVVDK
jgi:cell division septation protein DedD